MPSPKLSIELFGGVNEYINAFNIGLEEAIELKNCDTSDNSLTRIKGYVPYIEESLPSGLGTIIPFYTSTGHKLLVASGDKLYKYEDNTFTEIASGFSSDRFDFVNFEIMGTDVVILTNGIDNVKVYNGTTIRDLKHDGKDSTDSSTNKAPKGSLMELHYSRVWIAKDNMLYFSTSNRDGFDPDDFTTPLDDEVEINQHGGYISIPTWDGGRIIGMKVIFDDIVVFKEKNIFKILGTYPGEYEVRQLFSTDGAIADKSIVAAQNVAYYLDNDGIFVYDGMNVNKISQPIQKTIESINLNYADKAVGVFYNDSYFLAVPTGDSLTNNLLIEYNALKKTFLLHEVSNIHSFLNFDNKLLFSDDTGLVYELFTGNSFNGEPIDSMWLSGVYDLGAKDSLKNTQYLYFAGIGNGQIKITCITERGERSTNPITLTNKEQVYKTKLKNKGRTIQLKFENIEGADFKIIRPELVLDMDYD